MSLQHIARRGWSVGPQFAAAVTRAYPARFASPKTSIQFVCPHSKISSAAYVTTVTTTADTEGTACFASTSLLNRCKRLNDSLIASNWCDTVKLVLNIPFWEAEMNALESRAPSFGNNPALQKSLSELQSIMDCLYKVEDVKDHINEIYVHSDRATGLAGTGFHAYPKVANVEQHIELLKDAYVKLTQEYKNDKVLLLKVDEVVGGGLAGLRQKIKFSFLNQNRFYY